MEPDWEADLADLNLPDLPGVVRVLGEPTPGGGHEIVRFSRDGRIVLASMYDGMSRAYATTTGEKLLDTSSYEVIDRLKANPRRARWEVVKFMASALGGFMGIGGGLNPKLTPAGKKLAATLTGPTGLADFDLAAKKVRRLKDADNAALSPDGRVWAGVEGEDPIAFYEAATGARITAGKRAPTCGDVGPRAFTSDGALFVAEAKAGTVGVWDTASGERTRLLKSHSGEVSALAVSRDGRFLASAGTDGALVLWSLESGAWIARQTGWAGGLSAMDFLVSAGKLVLAATDGETLAILDGASLQPLTRIARGDQGLGLCGLAASPDGTLLALGRRDDRVYLLDVAALLAQPEKMENDPVRVVTQGPPTAAEDRQAARALARLLEAALEECRPAVEAELRALTEGLPPGVHRLVFWYEGGEVTGDGLGWQAFDGQDGEVSEGSLQVFSKRLLPSEAMDDPRYHSARATPWETVENRFPAWFSECWRAAVESPIRATLSHSDGHTEYDLRTGERTGSDY